MRSKGLEMERKEEQYDEIRTIVYTGNWWDNWRISEDEETLLLPTLGHSDS